MRYVAILLLALPVMAFAEDALVAVSTNFYPVLDVLQEEFEASTGHDIAVASGSTGLLHAQIINGAPFDLFLAADQERPARLEESGHGVAGSRFTYATGRLVLWSTNRDLIRARLRETLRQHGVRRLAIANPSLAPYGQAAKQVLHSLEMWDTVSSRVVMGENISQVFSLAATGNADVAFVAMSQVLMTRRRFPGAFIDIREGLYDPIRQDAILLSHGATNTAAIEFAGYLKSDAVRERIATFGYGTE